MPNYAYTIRDAAGSPISGTSEAESEDILRKRLTEQGFAVLDVKQVKSSQKKVGGFGGIKKTDLSIMCRQFSTMIDAGVNLVRCLNVLSDQATSPKLKAILTDVRTEVEGGSTLTRALEKYPTVFDRLFLGLVNAGEVGGALGVPDGLPHHAHPGKKLAQGKIHRGFVNHSAADEHGFYGIQITLQFRRQIVGFGQVLGRPRQLVAVAGKIHPDAIIVGVQGERLFQPLPGGQPLIRILQIDRPTV